MDNPITDSESLSEEPQSFVPVPKNDHTVTVTIVHHNGSEEVTGFNRIEEIDAERQTIRVWYDDADYVDYHVASIVAVEP